jgi:hypothetical protein
MAAVTHAIIEPDEERPSARKEIAVKGVFLLHSLIRWEWEGSFGTLGAECGYLQK